MHSNEVALAYQTSAAHVYDLLKSAGHKPVISERLLAAALELQPTPDSSDLLAATRSFFSRAAVIIPDGLDTLPATWLQQIPAILWRSRKPHWTSLPYMIRRLGLEQGVMCVSFAQELPNDEDRLTAWDRLRVLLNVELRPNLWQPLSKSLQRRLWNERPELRSELFRVL